MADTTMDYDIHADIIVILDFGSQYTRLIARRIREIGVYCEIHPCTIDAQSLKKLAPRGIVLSGGPDSVALENAPCVPATVFEMGVPVLGICYGMQVMARQLGGSVAMAEQHELGYACLHIDSTDTLFEGLEQANTAAHTPAGLQVWMSHGDSVQSLPPGFERLAHTDNCPVAAMADRQRHFYGLQFHPEVTHTTEGTALLERFVCTVADCKKQWTTGAIIEDAITSIRAQVGDEKVLLGLSGGVDSSVVAALLHRAIGEQLVCVFVDNGLLRAGESEQVMSLFDQVYGMRVIRSDAQALFLSRLAGIADPERKRKIIGNTFIEVFEKEAAKLQGIHFLAQGTIYPDVIESAAVQTGKAHVIKSHHNVGGLPERMKMELVEPLAELFKDEVRAMGVALGLPDEQVYRHPFPGPGLAVRVLGEVKAEYLETVRRADAIFLQELVQADLYRHTSQAFAVFMPVKSVGVAGDKRRYAHVIALRAVETTDFMTARWSHLPHEFLERVSSRIINEIEDVSRVTYDISSKPPATIEWE